MSANTVAILGAGHMGRALIGGLLRRGMRAEKIQVAEVAADAQLKMAPAPFGNGNGNGNGQTQSKRVPFKLSPNGTDVPATESVPASSGPSVPNFLPSPLAPFNDPNVGGAFVPRPEVENRDAEVPPTLGTAPAPVRIPFKKTSPATDEEAKPTTEPWLTKESLAAAEETPASTLVSETARVTEVKIALPLLPILKSLPPMQLTGDPGCVPPDVRIEFAFALIEPQLASGRISVTAKVFEVSLPVSFRGLFQAGPGAVDVALPQIDRLHDVHLGIDQLKAILRHDCVPLTHSVE